MFINTKHPILKEKTHIEYKNYRNKLSTLTKKSKQTYSNKDFETNWNNIKNTRKGIKSLISLQIVASSAPTVLSRDNGNTWCPLSWKILEFKFCPGMSWKVLEFGGI